MHITNSTLLVAAFFVAMSPATAAVLDFRQAVIVVGNNPAPRMKKAAVMLAEEIEKRTQLRLKTVAAQKPGSPAIVIASAGGRCCGRLLGFDLRRRRGGPCHCDRQRRARRDLRQRLSAAAVSNGAPEARTGFGVERSQRTKNAGARSSTRLPSQDQFLRRLERADVGAVHPRTGNLREQHRGTDAAKYGRRCRQPAFPVAADRDDGGDVAHRRRVRPGCVGVVSRRWTRDYSDSENGRGRAEGVGEVFRSCRASM